MTPASQERSNRRGTAAQHSSGSLMRSAATQRMPEVIDLLSDDEHEGLVQQPTMQQPQQQDPHGLSDTDFEDDEPLSSRVQRQGMQATQPIGSPAAAPSAGGAAHKDTSPPGGLKRLSRGTGTPSQLPAAKATTLRQESRAAPHAAPSLRAGGSSGRSQGSTDQRSTRRHQQQQQGEGGGRGRRQQPQQEERGGGRRRLVERAATRKGAFDLEALKRMRDARVGAVCNAGKGEEEHAGGEHDSALEDEMDEDEEEGEDADDEGNLRGFVVEGGEDEEQELANNPEAQAVLHQLHEQHAGTSAGLTDRFHIYVHGLGLQILGEELVEGGLYGQTIKMFEDKLKYYRDSALSSAWVTQAADGQLRNLLDTRPGIRLAGPPSDVEDDDWVGGGGSDDSDREAEAVDAVYRGSGEEEEEEEEGQGRRRRKAKRRKVAKGKSATKRKTTPTGKGRGRAGADKDEDLWPGKCLAEDNTASSDSSAVEDADDDHKGEADEDDRLGFDKEEAKLNAAWAKAKARRSRAAWLRKRREEQEEQEEEEEEEEEEAEEEKPAARRSRRRSSPPRTRSAARKRGKAPAVASPVAKGIRVAKRRLEVSSESDSGGSGLSDFIAPDDEEEEESEEEENEDSEEEEEEERPKKRRANRAKAKAGGDGRAARRVDRAAPEGSRVKRGAQGGGKAPQRGRLSGREGRRGGGSRGEDEERLSLEDSMDSEGDGGRGQGQAMEVDPEGRTQEEGPSGDCSEDWEDEDPTRPPRENGRFNGKSFASLRRPYSFVCDQTGCRHVVHYYGRWVGKCGLCNRQRSPRHHLLKLQVFGQSQDEVTGLHLPSSSPEEPLHQYNVGPTCGQGAMVYHGMVRFRPRLAAALRRELKERMDLSGEGRTHAAGFAALDEILGDDSLMSHWLKQYRELMRAGEARSEVQGRKEGRPHAGTWAQEALHNLHADEEGYESDIVWVDRMEDGEEGDEGDEGPKRGRGAAGGGTRGAGQGGGGGGGGRMVIDLEDSDDDAGGGGGGMGGGGGIGVGNGGRRAAAGTAGSGGGGTAGAPGTAFSGNGGFAPDVDQPQASVGGRSAATVPLTCKQERQDWGRATGPLGAASPAPAGGYGPGRGHAAEAAEKARIARGAAMRAAEAAKLAAEAAAAAAAAADAAEAEAAAAGGAARVGAQPSQGDVRGSSKGGQAEGSWAGSAGGRRQVMVSDDEDETAPPGVGPFRGNTSQAPCAPCSTAAGDQEGQQEGVLCDCDPPLRAKRNVGAVGNPDRVWYSCPELQCDFFVIEGPPPGSQRASQAPPSQQTQQGQRDASSTPAATMRQAPGVTPSASQGCAPALATPQPNTQLPVSQSTHKVASDLSFQPWTARPQPSPARDAGTAPWCTAPAAAGGTATAQFMTSQAVPSVGPSQGASQIQGGDEMEYECECEPPLKAERRFGTPSNPNVVWYRCPLSRCDFFLLGPTLPSPSQDPCTPGTQAASQHNTQTFTPTQQWKQQQQQGGSMRPLGAGGLGSSGSPSPWLPATPAKPAGGFTQAQPPSPPDWQGQQGSPWQRQQQQQSMPLPGSQGAPAFTQSGFPHSQAQCAPPSQPQSGPQQGGSYPAMGQQQHQSQEAWEPSSQGWRLPQSQPNLPYGTSLSTPPSQAAVSPSQPASQQQQQGTGSRTGACFTCGQEGHWTADCPKKGGNVKTGSCYTCGQPGHWSSNCPNKRAGGSGTTGGGGARRSSDKCFKCGRVGHWSSQCPG